MNMTERLLTICATDSRVSAYVQSSFANLSRKLASGTYDDALAHKLLRNNAVDAAKAMPYFDRMAYRAETLDAVAASLLTQWESAQ